jgi:hypothetical protein
MEVLIIEGFDIDLSALTDVVGDLTGLFIYDLVYNHRDGMMRLL